MFISTPWSDGQNGSNAGSDQLQIISEPTPEQAPHQRLRTHSSRAGFHTVQQNNSFSIKFETEKLVENAADTKVQGWSSGIFGLYLA